MEFDYCISNPAFNVAEGNNIAGTGGNTTLYRTATRYDFDNRLKDGGTLVNITLKGIINYLVNGYFKDYQINWIHLMDNFNVWPYNTCIFSVSKKPRTSDPIILGGLASKIYSPNPDDCFPFVYYSSNNNGLNHKFGPNKTNKVIRKLPGKDRDTVEYDYTDDDVSAGPKFAFYVMESRKSYTITSEPIYGGTICYIPFATETEAEKMKLFVEKNPLYKEYVKRMNLRGHAFGLRNVRKFNVNQIVTGLETPAEWNISNNDLVLPTVLEDDITKNKDRIKTYGEVFTPTSLVNIVLDLIELNDPTVFINPSKTFIDSMCGNGQFLEGIKDRNVNCSNIYGIEISPDNVDACKSRLSDCSNIVCADSFGPTFTKAVNLNRFFETS